ncbi:MAG: hypothetical protein HY551_03110, partial [Elusimicrobia bacterium]|nr:hypothetical protein [Elusimicrobiota bacterium]
LAAAHTNGAPKGIADEERPFSFIREEHLPKLAYLMRRGTPEHLAMVIHYLPPHIASRFLESQSDGVRTRVAHYLADVTELEEAAVREVEKWIKTRIDFLVGGEEKLAEIIEGIPSEKQEEFLSKVAAKDPLIRTRLERRLVRIEDLAGLEAAELQAVLRKVPMQTVAQVLKARQDLADQIVPKLSVNIAERLREEMALARDIPDDRLRAETLLIVKALKEMVRQGAVVLTKGLLKNAEPNAAPKTSDS